MLLVLHIHLYNSQIIWCENKIILRAIETGLQLNIILPDQFLIGNSKCRKSYV